MSKTYLVRFASGREIYVCQFAVQKVIDYCELAYQNDEIESIYEEVYVAEMETE